MPSPPKQELREAIWSRLEESGAARFPGARGRIPNFAGAREAAGRLEELPAWREAGALKCNPDMPQLPVRTAALRAGKTVYMAVPRLREERCFLELDPASLEVGERQAASIKGASRHGRPVYPGEMPRIDLVVAGSVAVRRDGARLGKGGGYSDLEFGLAAELGLVGPWTTVVTTVHPIQVTDRDLPMLAHDVPLDVIVTPEETIHCDPGRPRPRGIRWNLLDDERIAAIPALAARRDA